MYKLTYHFRNCHGEKVPVVLLFATARDAQRKAIELKNCRECKNLKVEEANAWRTG